MNNIVSILLICSFIFAISCSKETIESIDKVFAAESSDWLETTQQEYDGPQIVRLAWGIFPKEFISEERFQEMAEAGITHCTDWRDYNFKKTQPGVKRILKSGANVNPENKEKIIEGDVVIYTWKKKLTD